MSSIIGTTADWYLMRGSGFVALILLTLTVCLGIANLARLARGPWSRTVAALVHRNVSLLAVVFLAVHVLTAISDKYVKVPALAILVPGQSGYAPFWVGLGALSVDLLIAVVITSLLRARLRYGSWRAIHWLAYLSWPTAMLHAIGSGSGTGVDTGRGWSTLIYLACALAFGAAVAARVAMGGRPQKPAPLRTTHRYTAPAPARRPETRTPAGVGGRSPAARASYQPAPARPSRRNP